MPYFVDLGEDKDFTFTNKLFFSEHPLLLGEYRQAFKNSNLILDFGYSEGYKKANTKKSLGSKITFFLNTLNILIVITLTLHLN